VRTTLTIASLGLALNAAASAPAAPLEFKKIESGIWKATVGTPEDLTLLGAAGVQPAHDGLARLPAGFFPFRDGDTHGHQARGKVALRFPLARDEEIYGLGVDFTAMRRTGLTYQLHVDHWGGRPGRTHAPVPFYVSTRGYGVFIDTSRYITVSIGLGVRLASADKPPVIDRTTQSRTWAALPRADSIEALVVAPGVDVYVFAGPTMMDAVRRYNLFCGGGALPPKWGLGFMTRTPTAYTADQVLDEIAAFRSRRIPLDMVGLEPGWHDHAYPTSFQWDATRFPDSNAFLTRLAELHVRANLWFNPYVSPTASLYQALLPFAGSHLVWNGIVPDYSMAEARARFQRHLRERVLGTTPAALGGFKIDEVDGIDAWLWPDAAEFPSGHDGEQMRQTYGLFLQRLVVDMYRDLNQRTLGQVRGTNGGASSFPFVIYNDNYDFDEYITAVGNTGFAGVLWSPEVRGGQGEDMLRRIQAVCFSPLALFNGWSTATKLWTHAEVADAIRDAIQLRMRLLPYWYSAFAQYHYQGIPVVRPMPLVEGFTPTASPDRNAITDLPEVKDQYLVGDALLVAPIRPGATSRRVVLPAGRWFDFYTGRQVGEQETIEVSPPPSQMPLFVRDGGLIPMIGERQFAPGNNEVLPLEIRHYGTKPGAAMLYDDDGETFGYEHGDYTWTRLTDERDAAGQWTGRVTPDANGKRWRYSDVRWTEMTR
jgi:alpha-glucosidase (family GH31 glycosyl hydrolase)